MKIAGHSRFRCLAFIVVSYSTVSSDAFAWRKFTCDYDATKIVKQGNNPRLFCPSPTQLPSGNGLRIAINGSMLRWNAIQPIQFQIQSTACAFMQNTNDGVSSIWLQNPMPAGSAPTAPATVRYQVNPSTCNMYETDIIFNSAVAFSTQENMQHLPFNTATTRNIYGLAAHELGHALGLAHEERGYNIMGDDASHVTFINTITDYRAGENASAGTQTYGAGTNGVDIGVTIMRYNSALTGTGPYSMHTQGVITDTTGAAAGSSPNAVIPGPNRRYNLTRGTTYRFPLTFENAGQTTPTTAGFSAVLSSSQNLSSPTTLSSWSFVSSSSFFTRDWPVETTMEVTIPSTANTGDAYLGFVMTCTLSGATGCPDSNVYNQSTYFAVNIL